MMHRTIQDEKEDERKKGTKEEEDPPRGWEGCSGVLHLWVNR